MRLDELEHWLTTSAAAKRLDRSRQGAINLALDGRVRAVQIGAKAEDVSKPAWAFDPESVKEFVAKEQKRGAWWS